MTKTIQSHSTAMLGEICKAEDNISPLLSVYNNLNKLYEALIRLDYAVDKNLVAQAIYNRGEKK